MEPEHQGNPVGWVAWRRELGTRYRSLPVDEAWALDALASGETFGGICAGLADWVDELAAPQRAATLLRGWSSEGLVSGISS